MIASLVFATFLCTATTDNADKCETEYRDVWAGVSEYHADKEACKAIKKTLFPDDVRANPRTGQYQFSGCYRVLPGEWVGMPKGSVYLINADESEPDSADDSFTDSAFKLEVEPVETDR